MSQPTFDPALLDQAVEGGNLDSEYYTSIEEIPETPDYLLARFKATDKGVILDEIKESGRGTGKLYCYANVVAEVTEGPHAGTRSYFMFNTKIPKNRDVSSMEDFLVQCGYKSALIEARRSGWKAVQALAQSVLDAGHTLGLKVRWRAQYVPTDPKDNKVKLWSEARTVAKSMKKFDLKDPKDPSKGHVTEIYDPESKTTLKAEIQILELKAL